MILTRHDIISQGKKVFEQEIIFTEEELKGNDSILSINNLCARVECEYVAMLTIIKIYLYGELVLKSTRTLRPVEYDFDEEDEIVLSHTDDGFDPDTMIRYDGGEFDLRPHLYSLLITSLPIQIFSSEDEEYISGDNWEVMTEEEFLKRRKEDVSSSPFASLLDEDFDD